MWMGSLAGLSGCGIPNLYEKVVAFYSDIVYPICRYEIDFRIYLKNGKSVVYVGHKVKGDKI